MVAAASAVIYVGEWGSSVAHASALPNPKRVTSTTEQIAGLITELKHVTSLRERQSMYDEIVLSYLDDLAAEP